MRRSVLLVVPLAVLLSGCLTSLSEDRVAPLATVTVSEDPFLFQRCIPDADVVVFIDGVEVATGTADSSGVFAVPIEAPADPESYEVHAECTAFTVDPGDDPTATETATLEAAELIVEPTLEMVPDPDVLTVGDTAFQLDGSWCVSGTGQSPFFEGPTLIAPVAEITFEGVTETITADDPQPFDDRWVLDLIAPDEPGTYEITGTCTYQDGFGPPQGETPEPTPLMATVDYPIAEVTVLAPEPEPEPQPEPQLPAVGADEEVPEAPRAQAVTANPAFTG